MAYFAWTDDLAVGIDMIDDDHRKLIDMVNELCDALEQGKARAMMDQLIDSMILYAQEHFDKEETEMLRINYPMYLNHKQEHEMLMREVAQLRKTIDSGVPVNAFEVGQLLVGWLRNHVMHVDMEMAAAFKKAK